MLTFRYDKSIQILMCAGLPILVALCVVLPWIFFYILQQATHFTLEIRIDAVAVGIIGVALIWILFMVSRTWYAFFTEYLVSEAGIKVRFFSSDESLVWDDLSTVHYRRLLGQIELRFHKYPRLVVLNNVDMNTRRKTLRSALTLIKQMSAVRIQESLI